MELLYEKVLDDLLANRQNSLIFLLKTDALVF